MNVIKGFKFGCDPEVFVVDAKGKPVPAALAGVPGTKTHPYPVEDGTVQVDGLAAEIGVTPCENFADWNRRIASVLGQLRAMIPEGHSLSVVPYCIFDEEVFNAAADCDKELGCSPDFDAWTGEVNPPPEYLENPFLRTASGHIHVGWGEDLDLGDDQHILNCRDLVKQLDWYLGAWSIRLDKDPMRRNLYGKAGAYRAKPYGVEYRVLSNFWIDNENRRYDVWNRMTSAIQDMRKQFLPEVAEEDNHKLIASINSSVRSAELEDKYRYPLVTDGTSKRSPYRLTPAVALNEFVVEV